MWECVNGTTRLVVGAILRRLSFGARLLPVCRVIVSLSLVALVLRQRWNCPRVSLSGFAFIMP